MQRKKEEARGVSYSPRVSDTVRPELDRVEAPTLLCPAVTVEAEGGALSLRPVVTQIRLLGRAWEAWDTAGLQSHLST